MAPNSELFPDPLAPNRTLMAETLISWGPIGLRSWTRIRSSFMASDLSKIGARLHVDPIAGRLFCPCRRGVRALVRRVGMPPKFTSSHISWRAWTDHEALSCTHGQRTVDLRHCELRQLRTACRRRSVVAHIVLPVAYKCSQGHVNADG